MIINLNLTYTLTLLVYTEVLLVNTSILKKRLISPELTLYNVLSSFMKRLNLYCLEQL